MKGSFLTYSNPRVNRDYVTLVHRQEHWDKARHKQEILPWKQEGSSSGEIRVDCVPRRSLNGRMDGKLSLDGHSRTLGKGTGGPH